MSTKIKPPILTVKEILNPLSRYSIPLYQRNYAWERAEIMPLLLDIYSKFKTGPSSNYYIGTLVVDEHIDGQFEIIDGQQRHTTLSLINAAIGGYLQMDSPDFIKYSNLKFEARIDSAKLINDFLHDFQRTLKTDQTKQSLHQISQAVKDIISIIEAEIPRSEWVDYFIFFYNQVKIIRVKVPEGTNINQYFEIMNNRGEQLEAHEVLKAQFLNKLLEQNHNEATRKSFAIIWDSCAQMDKQVQMCFDTKLRRDIFNPDIQHIPADYLKSIPETTVMVKNECDADSLKSILEKSKLTINQTDKQEEKESRFRSITDFPNFLLLVLSLNEKNISLDDKRLLEEFGCIHQSQKELPDPIEFINNLLFYRTCFDRYIIKRETGNDGWNWKILRPNEDPNGDYINSFKDNNRSIIMVQAMLQVSFPGNNYKNWLKQVLLFFKKGQQLNEVDFLPNLENICTELFNKQEKNLNHGTSTPAYVFNYLDYLLWKLYDKYVRVEGPEIKQNNLIALIKNNKDRFNNFRFTQNNSVEHVAPRNPEGEVEPVNKIDEFGNLCLISRSVNSKLSNRGFPSKKAYYVDIYKANQNRAESLKQVIIFNYHEWKDKEIEEHGKEMLAVLNGEIN